MTEQYQCQSYSDDDRNVQDCTCGKCGETPDTEWEEEFDATFDWIDEYIRDKPIYNHDNDIKYFIPNIFTSRDDYWKEFDNLK